MRIAAFVSSNGLGHLRRLVGVLSRVRERIPDVWIDLICSKWQIEAMMDWPRARALVETQTRHIDGVMEPGVKWARDASAYDSNTLNTWHERLKIIPELTTPDLVLSDNLVGVLTVFPDAILSGSFLWSDVLEAAYPQHPNVATFVQFERALLERYCPPMLCVSDIATQGVIQRTQPIGVGWMCEEPSDFSKATMRSVAIPRIGVLGGATKMAQEILGEAVQALLALGSFNITLPARDIDALGLNGVAGVMPFRFQPVDYQACDIIVLRPGVGTMTDCVAHSIPMIALHEPGNVELEHNGRRLEMLGLGRYLGSTSADIVAVVNEELQARARTVERMQMLDRNGLAQAADWLTERLTNPPR